MLISVGLTLAVVLVAMAIRFEMRSALYGITLSNGVEVLVSPQTYDVIVRRYHALVVPDEDNRWDQAILDILRVDRPSEWTFLVRSLGFHVATDHFATSRR